MDHGISFDIYTMHLQRSPTWTPGRPRATADPQRFQPPETPTKSWPDDPIPILQGDWEAAFRLPWIDEAEDPDQ